MARDPLERLYALRGLRSRKIVGLMSGTSADGIDAALCEIAGSGETTKATMLAFETVPFGGVDLAQRLIDGDKAGAAEICELNFLAGEAFAEAAERVVRAAGLGLDEIDLVASHGQTICHQPRSAGRRGATLQIGEGAVIAERLGVPVVCDFRVRDLAAGGEGAPLVPLADHYLFRQPQGLRVALNLGGIANVTLVGQRLDQVIAFDTGPGNMALDLVARAASNGAERYDDGGRRAARGRVEIDVIRELFQAPFFGQPPPRSTGREVFGRAWVEPLVRRFAGRFDDLLATLTRFTAEAIHASTAAWILPRGAVTDVLASGGGVHNRTLMTHLADLFAPTPVRSTAEVGVDPDAKEAIAFAILGNETLHGLPGNVPGATGAARPRVLGKIVLP